ncbi:HAAS signaling domain-containing protein [Kribbella pittospori]|uniref:HAAS signaling domain-containing protein n=1 Tax=Kribbella pittospori TaxID=722689 RepID=UPI0013F42A4C|nr:hypothetical protein [Kribbella pittospori]
MNSTLTGAVATYLTQVRAELSDLPAGELEDVLEDVSGHLTEVAGEFDEEPTSAALQERLGTPRQYADELRTAAGYPPRTQPVADRDAGRKALRWGLIAATVGPFFIAIGVFAWSHEESAFFGFVGFAMLFGAAYLGVRALRGHDPRIVLDTPRGEQSATAIRGMIEQIPPNVRYELVSIGQPVWWVVRGVIGGGGFFALWGAGAVTVVGALAGAAISIWIGRRTQQDRRWLWYVIPLNIVATIAVPAFLAAAYMGASFGFLNNYGDYSGSSSTYNPPDGLMYGGGNVSNLYPFDAQGKQVSVRLYDQDGNPISLQPQDCAASFSQRPEVTSNLFPQAVVSPDENGNVDAATCKDSTKAPFVPPPAPATSLPPTSTPNPTPANSTQPTAKAPTPKPGVTLTVSPTR